MLPTRTASAFHAAVHDLKVQRLARAAAKVDALLGKGRVTLQMPLATPTSVFNKQGKLPGQQVQHGKMPGEEGGRSDGMCF
jgi:hypothetical protein